MCREEEREYVLTCINKFNKKIKLAELDRNHEKIQKYKDKKDRNLYKCKNIASDISFKTCLPFCYIKDDNI